VVLILGHFGKQGKKNTWKVLKCRGRKMEEISWSDRVGNEEVLDGVKECNPEELRVVQKWRHVDEVVNWLYASAFL
jgi:hypothetical protein